MRNLFKPGNRLIVKQVNYQHRAGKMLIDMGITPETMLLVDRVAPLGEPFIIKVRDYSLALRKSDLMALTVELR
ncbi:MAG TPA: FeoA domain-containing protein [Clostridia bacterium]|nr:FeoA domain-containing protein [Clostridia bacterium]